jgi:uncharacterized protein (DUF58 family)
MDENRIYRSARKLQLISHKLVESLLAGNYRSVFKGQGIEFDEVREYVEGDDARLIDWNVSSRMGTPFTKMFREERELTLFLLVDMSASMAGGTAEGTRQSVQRLLFSLLSLAAAQNNDKMGAVFYSDEIEHWVSPVKGRKHALRLIQDMVRFEPKGKGSDLALALRTAGEALKRRGICVILSDFKTTGYFKDLSLLSRRHDVIAVRIVDPIDELYPETGLFHLEDPETGRSILAPGKSRRFRKQYHDYWAEERRRWERECRRRGVSTLEVGTDEDPAAKLLHFFQRRRS